MQDGNITRLMLGCLIVVAFALDGITEGYIVVRLLFGLVVATVVMWAFRRMEEG